MRTTTKQLWHPADQFPHRLRRKCCLYVVQEEDQVFLGSPLVLGPAIPLNERPGENV